MKRWLLAIQLSLLVAPIAGAAASQPAPSSGPSTASPMPMLDAAARRRVIETAIAKMAENYVFPDKVPAIGKALRAGLAGKYRAISDANAFADAVNADIESAANDRHL